MFPGAAIGTQLTIVLPNGVAVGAQVIRILKNQFGVKFAGRLACKELVDRVRANPASLGSNSHRP